MCKMKNWLYIIFTLWSQNSQHAIILIFNIGLQAKQNFLTESLSWRSQELLFVALPSTHLNYAMFYGLSSRKPNVCQPKKTNADQFCWANYAPVYVSESRQHGQALYLVWFHVIYAVQSKEAQVRLPVLAQRQREVGERFFEREILLRDVVYVHNSI